MTIPRFFGPYGSAALAQIDTLATAGANACWLVCQTTLISSKRSKPTGTIARSLLRRRGKTST